MLTQEEIERMTDVELVGKFWDVGKKVGIGYCDGSIETTLMVADSAAPFRAEILRRMGNKKGDYNS